MKLNRIVGVLLSLCLIISTSINANASEIRPQDEEIAAIAIASDETNFMVWLLVWRNFLHDIAR